MCVRVHVYAHVLCVHVYMYVVYIYNICCKLLGNQVSPLIFPELYHLYTSTCKCQHLSLSVQLHVTSVVHACVCSILLYSTCTLRAVHVLGFNIVVGVNCHVHVHVSGLEVTCMNL